MVPPGDATGGSPFGNVRMMVEFPPLSKSIGEVAGVTPSSCTSTTRTLTLPSGAVASRTVIFCAAPPSSTVITVRGTPLAVTSIAATSMSVTVMVTVGNAIEPSAE